MTTPMVQHDSQRHCFFIPAEGKEALLEYRLLGGESQPAGVDFTHTYVPPELRGRGLAEALVRQGLKWAREHDYEIRASCWYVAKFLR